MAQDVYLLDVIGTTAGEYNECVIACQGAMSSSTTPQADAAALISAWTSTVQPLWVSCVATDYSLAGYKARRVNNGGGPTASQQQTITGTVSGTSAPPQCAQLLTAPYKPTGGKWRTGRIFVPSVPESGYTAPNLTPAQLVLLNALAAALIAGFGSTPGPWQVGTWARKTAVFYDGLYQASLRIGTIRKRLNPVL